MKPEKQRIAIAEFCGYKFTQGDDGEYHRYAPNGEHEVSSFINMPLSGLPNYLLDLNAMHEAESLLDANGQICERNIYAEQLCKSVHPGMAMNHFWEMWCCIHATATQRAEALLKTIGRWS